MPSGGQVPTGCRGCATSHRPALSHSHDGYLWIPRSWHRGGRRWLERSRSPRQHDKCAPPRNTTKDGEARLRVPGVLARRPSEVPLSRQGRRGNGPREQGFEVERFYVSVSAGGLSLGARGAQAGRTPINTGASSVHLSFWSCSLRCSRSAHAPPE
jgi:hypothetical protein